MNHGNKKEGGFEDKKSQGDLHKSMQSSKSLKSDGGGIINRESEIESSASILFNLEFK